MLSTKTGVVPVMAISSLTKVIDPAGKLPNKPVPGAKEFYPLNEPAIGSALDDKEWPKNATLPKLFTPIKLRDTTFKNRIWVSPMCQYSSPNGLTTDWHLVHIGQFAIRGAGAICMEATSVTPEGRITPQDNGIWSDEHIPGLKRIVDFVHAQGTVIGIQLAHAGRKASTRAPWAQNDLKGSNLDDSGSHVASVEEGGWPNDVIAPSPIPFVETYPHPKEMSLEGIATIIDAFEAAVHRAKAAGFDFIEIHGAHGYLIHEFFSPLSNKRTDKYGGSLENRLRFPLEISQRARKAWGEEKPIFFRVSGTDWAEGPEQDESGVYLQWGTIQSTILAAQLVSIAGIDLLDVSSGGNWVKQKIPVGPSYQIPLAEYIKKHLPKEASGLLVTSVGLITEPKQAEELIQDGKVDAVWLAREFLRHADFVLDAAMEFKIVVRPAVQYERAWTRMYKD